MEKDQNGSSSEEINLVSPSKSKRQRRHSTGFNELGYRSTGQLRLPHTVSNTAGSDDDTEENQELIAERGRGIRGRGICIRGRGICIRGRGKGIRGRGRGVGMKEEDAGRNNNKHGSSRVRMRGLLNELGLRRYMPLFEFHGVNDETLPNLSLDELKDIGIAEVGPRKRIFGAIQKLSEPQGI